MVSDTREIRLPDAIYGRDPGNLGHFFFAITGATDQCDNCGCSVGEFSNHPGLKGGRYDEPCREPTWTCDDCGEIKPHGASFGGAPDVVCRGCLSKRAAEARQALAGEAGG